MTNSKLLLFFFMFHVCFQASAQRRGSRSYKEVKQEMINTTVKLTEIRTYLGEKTSDKISVAKTITFTEDSIIVVTNDIRATGTWVKGTINFTMLAPDGKRIKYNWLFGRKGEPCYQVGDTKKTVECYQRVK